MKKKEIIRAICGTCLSTRQNQVTGYCIKNHDNWIEDKDIQIMYNILDGSGRMTVKEDSTFPHIIPMFKALAKRLGIASTTLGRAIINNPTIYTIVELSKQAI